MLDTSRIKTRISEIDKRIQVLNGKFRGLTEEELIGDENLNAAAERHLQVAIQACIDIANHIISALTLKKPEEKTGEVFPILASEDIIPKELADKLVDATGYRNVVVHDYTRVDRHITYENIQEHLTDLSEFTKHIELFLEKQQKKNS